MADGPEGPEGRANGESGQAGLIGMVVVLLIIGLLSAVAFGAFDGTTGGGGPNGSSFTGSANDVSAKTSLSQAQTFAQSLATGGVYGAISAGGLQASGSGLTFTAGPSTSEQTVSVASTPDSATLAAYSSSGNCWYIWLGSGGPLYGAQTGQQSCQATGIPAAPSAGPVSSSDVGWSTGTYPAT